MLSSDDEDENTCDKNGKTLAAATVSSTVVVANINAVSTSQSSTGAEEESTQVAAGVNSKHEAIIFARIFNEI